MPIKNIKRKIPLNEMVTRDMHRTFNRRGGLNPKNMKKIGEPGLRKILTQVGQRTERIVAKHVLEKMGYRGSAIKRVFGSSGKVNDAELERLLKAGDDIHKFKQKYEAELKRSQELMEAELERVFLKK